MKLKTRIFLLAPIAMAGMLLVGSVFYIGDRVMEHERAVLAEAEHIFELEADMDVSMLQARRAEKDFLLRGDEKYVARHKEVSDKAVADLAEISSLLRTDFPGEMDEAIAQLEQGFGTYIAKFAELVEKNSLLGLDETSGLQGSLRSAVKTAEENLDTLNQPELTVKMLMMRRHEKDFIMRVDEKYVGRLDERVAEFKAFPLEMFGSIAARNEIFALIDTYQADFHKFAEATFEERALRKELSAAFSDIEPVFEEIKAFVEDVKSRTKQTLAQEKETVFATVAGIGALAVLIIGLIVVFVARSVGKPLTATASALRALSEGNTEIEIAGLGRKDEIGEIANAFEAYQALVQRRAREEQEAVQARDADERSRTEADHKRDAEQKRQLEATVSQMGEALDRLANGDLTARIDKPFSEGLDGLRVSFNTSVEKLAETLSEVRTNIDTIHANAGEMRTAVESLSGRTEQQAASLEETSASLEEITSTVKSSSERAQEATKKAAEARSASDSSTKVVNDAVDAMGRIESASGEIAKIIGVIDEIAFQTNLLALNAGVEAARAGEAGKGFAVVAQEVRELAQRSASAAKEIKDLIGKSTNEVENGVDLVKATGEALTTIAKHVTDISDHIGSIAKAAVEQSTGLQEINTAVSQMDKVTQQNAAMVEETTAVTHRLAGDATGLSELVSRFSLPDGRAAKPAKPVAVGGDQGRSAANDAQSKSPAKTMINKVRQAFSGNAAVAADEWAEF
jgi:methyl-accepting chemotaxis protein